MSVDQLRRAAAWIILVGVVLFVFGLIVNAHSDDSPTSITCGSQVMSAGDSCVGSRSGTKTYAQLAAEKRDNIAWAQANGPLILWLAGAAGALGVVVLVVASRRTDSAAAPATDDSWWSGSDGRA